jgi:hypothetical protein
MPSNRRPRLSIRPQTSSRLKLLSVASAAEALFVAAIHNAYCGQGCDIVAFQCAEALRQDPSIAETMVRFLDSTLRREPSVICGSMAAIAQDTSDQDAVALQIFHALPPLKKNLNLVLSDVLVSLLGTESRQLADRLLTSEFSLTSLPTDLLERFYSSASLQDWDWINKTMYYRAHQRESKFRLICSSVCAVRLTLTARVRGAGQTPSPTLSVSVNGIEVTSLAASKNWQSWEIDVSESFLGEGLNTIAIKWPYPAYSRADRMTQITEQVERGGVPDISLVYGEVCRFTAAAHAAVEQANRSEYQPVFWPEVESLLAGSEAIDRRPDGNPMASLQSVSVTG